MKAIAIWYADQCDKKKCTSIRLYNQKHKISIPILWLTDIRKIYSKSLVLTPYGQFLLPHDIDIYESSGITVLDCSWKQNDPILTRKFQNARKLPKLLAANPVNYGRWEFLTSIEAVAAALYIMGVKKESLEILSCFGWGVTFFKFNEILLAEYQKVQSIEEYETI